MIARETTDAEEIKKVLFEDDVWRRTGAEYIEKEMFEPPADAQYIGGYVDDEIIGLMIYNRDGERLKCHFQVILGFRTKYAREFARMALEIGEAKNASIYAEIPDCYPEVIRLAEEFDFKVVGKEKAGAIVDGVKHDIQILRRDNVPHTKP